MSSVQDQLVSIPKSQWIMLRDMFQHPNHQIAYHTINNFIQWHVKDKNIKNLEILSLNGNWRQNGVYLIIVSLILQKII